jgi:hypothetical protein
MNHSSDVPIEPSVITEVKTITNFRLTTQDLVLFTSVTFRVELLNDTGNLLDLKYVVVSGDDYSNWNNDDTYIINKVAEKLGFVVKPSEPAAEPAPTEPAAAEPAPAEPSA